MGVDESDDFFDGIGAGNGVAGVVGSEEKVDDGSDTDGRDTDGSDTAAWATAQEATRLFSNCIEWSLCEDMK